MPIQRKSEAPKPTRYGWVIALLGVGVAGYFLWRAPTDRPFPEEPLPVESSADLDESAPVASRCEAISDGRGGLLGKSTAAEESDEFAPFAPELGRGAAVSGGFAVGVKHEIEGIMHNAVALVSPQGGPLAIQELDTARGDLDAPLVLAHGDGWVAAFLEPDASGLALRLVRGGAAGDDLAWGAEISQGRDESQGYDMAFGERAAVLAWDDLTEDRARGVIMVADLAVPSLEGGEDAAALSREDVDAELPRVIARPGGFWLAYVASRPVADADAGAPAPAKPQPPKPPGPKPPAPKTKAAKEKAAKEKAAKEKPKPKPKVDDDEDPGREGAQEILPSWIELAPLDELGKLQGPPRPVTDESGHVLAYDIEPAPDGAALIAWRDDDTPTGAHGGRVSLILVNASGAGAQQTVAEEHVGAGVPELLQGWLMVPDEHGQAQLAPMSPEGELTAPLQIEPLLGSGELLAASGDVLLQAQPSGRAIRLVTLKCQR
jgi:hypothetical protein